MSHIDEAWRLIVMPEGELANSTWMTREVLRALVDQIHAVADLHRRESYNRGGYIAQPGEKVTHSVCKHCVGDVFDNGGHSEAEWPCQTMAALGEGGDR